VSGLQLLLAHGVKVAILATLVGALVRGHYKRAWSFVVYLAVILTCNTLVTTWPDAFRTHEFWLLKQGAYDVLKLLIAIELGYRAVRAFPGAAAGARAAALVGLTASLGVILTGGWLTSYHAQYEWQPQIQMAAVWMFALVALLVAWYHLPMDGWHRAIVMGFAPYLLLFVALLSVLERQGWKAWQAMSLIDSAAYLALVCWWAWASWQPAPAPVPREAILRALEGRGALERA
jgi:hypothetical protein